MGPLVWLDATGGRGQQAALAWPEPQAQQGAQVSDIHQPRDRDRGHWKRTKGYRSWGNNKVQGLGPVHMGHGQIDMPMAMCCQTQVKGPGPMDMG